PSSYCLFVKATPIVPSPTQEAMQSMDARPGKSNIGRINGVKIAPINSNKPKSVKNGSKKPANKKMANKSFIRSYKIKHPVSADQTEAGTKSKEVSTPKIKPIKRTTVQMTDTSNNSFKNLFLRINFG